MKYTLNAKPKIRPKTSARLVNSQLVARIGFVREYYTRRGVLAALFRMREAHSGGRYASHIAVLFRPSCRDSALRLFGSCLERQVDFAVDRGGRETDPYRFSLGETAHATERARSESR